MLSNKLDIVLVVPVRTIRVQVRLQTAPVCAVPVRALCVLFVGGSCGSVGAASGARDDPKMEIKGMYIVYAITASNNPGQALKKCFDPVVLWAERARFVLRGTARN